MLELCNSSFSVLHRIHLKQRQQNCGFLLMSSIKRPNAQQFLVEPLERSTVDGQQNKELH